MIKKLNISSQLFMLLFTIILIASCSFIIITLQCITMFAESEVYSRLSTYTYFIDSDTKIDEDIKMPDMPVGFIIKKADNEYIYDKVELFLSDEDLDGIVNDIENINITTENPIGFTKRGTFRSDKTKVYYFCRADKDLSTYTIIFTDSSFTNSVVREVSLQIIIIFFLIILISIFAMYLWSNKFVVRIKKLQHHIVNLPRKKYETIYLDNVQDEIGSLSDSVEEMRKEICYNEQTKQEMLQNLSHDFKTPIAVIKSYAEAQQDGVVGEEGTKIIIAQADLLKKKVNRLLQYNSLEYIDKNKEFEDVYMKEIIEEVIEAYKFQTDIEFDLDLDPNIIFKGFRENWYTVVDNIVDNAKRYAKTKIKIVLKPNRLRVYNDGEHIDESFIKNMFKPYEKGSKGEFGLGMSIVQRTVEFFEMRLSVVNEEIGVSFIITKE